MNRKNLMQMNRNMMSGMNMMMCRMFMYLKNQ